MLTIFFLYIWYHVLRMLYSNKFDIYDKDINITNVSTLIVGFDVLLLIIFCVIYIVLLIKPDENAQSSKTRYRIIFWIIQFGLTTVGFLNGPKFLDGIKKYNKKN
jgi:hypothetical protein